MRVLACLLFVCVGCITKGRTFTSDLRWVIKEKTTKRDVRLMLGQPFMVGSAGGVLTWSYGLYHYRIIGSDYIKELKLEISLFSPVFLVISRNQA